MPAKKEDDMLGLKEFQIVDGWAYALSDQEIVYRWDCSLGMWVEYTDVAIKESRGGDAS